jgi:Cu2+-exporting ATPase
LAIIAISDTIRPSAYEAVKMLHNMGIEVFLLTGVNCATANAVAKTLGIQHFESEVLPQQKASSIQNLQQKGKVVAMIGDGINDSQALAIADLGIAMGSGTHIAIDVAQITLITKDLKALLNALKLSEKTVKIIKQDLFWAFVYNVIGIPVAAGVLYPINGYLLNPIIAGAAMAFSSVSVVVNSLRLKSVNLEVLFFF